MTADLQARVEALWRFGVAWWGRDGVEETCLDWQGRFDFDVSLFVCCLWLEAVEGRVLSAQELGDAEEHVHAWRQAVIVPARATRRHLRKTDPELAGYHAEHLYDSLRKIELMGEQREQLMLLEWLQAADGRGSTDHGEAGLTPARQLIRSADRLTDEDNRRLALICDGALSIIRDGPP